jgi:hypothetical protein
LGYRLFGVYHILSIVEIVAIRLPDYWFPRLTNSIEVSHSWETASNSATLVFPNICHSYWGHWHIGKWVDYSFINNWNIYVI